MIPLKYRKVINSSDFFRKCIICHSPKVEIHHVFIYAGKQINELWNYIPLCKEHHAECTPHNKDYIAETRYYVEWYALLKMSLQDKNSYPKFNWAQHKKFLDDKFLWQGISTT